MPTTPTIRYPAWYDPDQEYEYQAKGRLVLDAVINQQAHTFTFYDPVRLQQDIAAELELGAAFYETRLVVLPSVTPANIERFLQQHFQVA